MSQRVLLEKKNNFLEKDLTNHKYFLTHLLEEAYMT